MTQKSNIDQLKRIAKQIARSKRIKLHQAQDLLAANIGYDHWYDIATSAKAGEQPTPVQMAMAQFFLEETNPAYFAGDVPQPSFVGPADDKFFDEFGEIDGHAYAIEVFSDDVHMRGKCWQIIVGEAPMSQPSINVTDRRFKNNPIHDPDFVEKALKIANAKAEQVRARIALDWPKQSTKPDIDGNVVHPIFSGVGNEWYCLHCDAKSTGPEISANLWHCPHCGASPMDIHTSRWWLGEGADAAE